MHFNPLVGLYKPGVSWSVNRVALTDLLCLFITTIAQRSVKQST